ncbi:MAG: hypothetical protein FVQ85_19435 [Planctomycetes bacterium]|nr:hypothetical protein [Planctomycetota bacterium]
MKDRLKLKFPSVIRIAFFTIIFSVVGFTSAAEAVQPGWKMVSADPISPEEARTYFEQLGGGGGAGGATGSGQTHPEITELARGLKFDPDLMYKFVHDHIEYTPYFGDLKGAYMTLMDRSGNSFDQSSLLISLLKEAEGEPDAPYTIQNPRYVYGNISLSFDDTDAWLGVSDPYALERLIASAGIPCTVYLNSITMDFLWVKVNIDGTDYVFDPSFKSHSFKSGINLATEMGYDQTSFLNNAKSGAVITTDSVRNINKANIASDLATYGTNLIDYIKTNDPGATLDDIIGGKNIIPASEVPIRQTYLPYELSTPSPLEWPNILDGYKTTLQIEYRGIDVTTFSSDIYGRRLTIFYNSLEQPELRLDGELLETGIGLDSDITLTVNHPYPGNDGTGTYCDQSRTFSIAEGGSYFIVNGWGNIGTKVIEKHRMILEQRIYAGDDVASEPVLGESLTILGLTWLAECSKIDQLSDQIANTHTINHHSLGVVGQKEGCYIDMPMGLVSLISLTNDTSKEIPVFFASGGHGSAFEWGVVRQLQPDRDAVSTVKLLDMANDRSTYDRIFEATTANWENSIKPLLQDYDSTELSNIQPYIDRGDRVILPEYGDLGEGAWKGMGFLAIGFNENSLGFIISGGYNGGYSTVQAPLSIPEFYASTIVDPVDLSSDSHFQSEEPIDMVTGSYLYEHADLAIGSGDNPLSLELKRSYNSKNRLNDGPLGLGWTHNFDITAKVSSDGFQSMGGDSPIDAAASIVQTYINIDLLCSDKLITNLMITTLSQRWLMDQMIDNIVTIKQPGNSMQFVKLPDGTYNPPPGRADELILNNPGPDEYFSLKGKQGNITEFNAEGLISNWSDPHDNEVTFQYEPYEIPGDYDYLNGYLVSHWALDESSGTTAYDSVNSINGTLYGDSTWITNGRFGGALELDGDYDYIEVPHNSSLAPAASDEQFTLSCWAKRDNPMRPYDGGVGMCQELFSSFGNRTAYEIQFQYWAGEVRTQARIEGLTIIYPVENPDTDWHMWSLTVDKVPDEKFALHMDGIEVVSGIYQSNIYYQSWPLYIGGSPDDSPDGPIDLDGSIDDVMFFDEVLTEEDLIGLYLGQHLSTTAYKLKEVSNNFGRTLTFAYGIDESHITSVTDSASPSRSVVFGYDPTKWNLTTVTNVENFNTTFEYDATNDGQLTKIFYPTDPVNPFVTNIYDDLGRVKKQTNANGYTYDYYYSYYRTEELEPLQTPPAEPPPPPPGGPPPPQRFSKVYYFNDYGSMVAEKDQLGREATYVYDGQQRLKRADYPTGNSTEYSYDGNHNITAIIKKPVQGSPEPDITEGFYYESHESASGRWFNQLKTHTDSAGKVTTYQYDYDSGGGEVGNLKEITYPAVYLPGGLGPFQPKTSFTYDTSSGQVLTETKKITDTDSTITKYEYDTPGHGGLKKTIVDHGGLSIVTEMDYDTVGNLKKVTDPRGNFTTYEYYSSRRLKKETAPAPFQYKTHYEYYPDGKPKLVKRQTEDPDIWQMTTYTYTPTGQKETVHGPIGPVAFDSVGDNHGTIYGAELTTGKVNGALEFDGNDDYIDVADDQSLDFGSDPFTFSAWIKLAGTGPRIILSKGNAGAGGKGVLFRIEANETARLIVTGDSEEVSAYSNNTLGTGIWYHVAATKSSAMTVYVNGDPGTPQNSPSGSINSSIPFRIGRWGSQIGLYFNGLMDEVMVFDRELLQAEIQQVRQNGVNGVNALTGFDPAEYPVSYWNFDDEGQVNLTRYEYDSLDRLWKTTDGEDNTTEQLYFPDGKPYKIVDAMNQDSVKHIYNPDGTLYSKSDAKGNTTIYEYDDHIRLKKTTYPDPSKYEELSYDSAGRLEEKRTRANDIITYSYDELNRLKTKTVPSMPDDSVTTYKYDLLSRQVEIVETIDGVDTIIYNEFDNAGGLKKVTYNYPSLDDKIIQYEYDAAGNRIELTYPDDGKCVRYHYDNLNRLVSIRSDDMIGYWNFDEGQGDIAHDVVGGNHGTVYGSLWTNGKVGGALEFDGENDYIEIPDSDDFNFEENDFTIELWANFDPSLENLSFWTQAADKDNRIQFHYDNQEIVFQDTSNDIVICSISQAWTPESDTWYHIALIRGFGGNTDNWTITINGEPFVSNICDNIITDRNEPINIGRMMSGAGAGEGYWDYSKGKIDEVTIHTRALTGEEIGDIYNGTNQDGMIASYAYDALSSRVSARYGNGTNAEYYYDMADRLLGLDNQTNSENLSYDYSYDNVGNRLTKLENSTDLHSYTYDNIYQLTNVDYPEDSFTDDTSFIYDQAGNRWQVIGGGIGPYYATNILNQYTSAGTVYFSYDDNGNLTGDGTDSYTYDAENRLMTANASGLSITYSYGPLGRRISKTVGGETTYYIYDGDQVICEYDDVGYLRKKFLYGVGIDEVVRMSQVGRTADISGPSGPPDEIVDIYDLRKMSEAWLKNEGDAGFNANADLNYDEKINNTDSDILSANWLSDAQLSEVYFYYHYDGLGSVIAISDSVGRVVEKYQYAVYGNPRILNQNNKQLTDSKYGNPYMFTGRRFDTETRLYYYRARYYSTEIGRFLQVDPIGYTDGLNLYAYCGNNPVVLIDPLGLTGEPVILSREEFENRMEPTISDILERSEWGGMWFWNYYIMADSSFHGDAQTYNYLGYIADGTEVNYYIQGILQEHYNIPTYNVLLLPFLHNLGSYGHLPTGNEYFFTELGRQEYDYWIDKEASKNTAVEINNVK